MKDNEIDKLQHELCKSRYHCYPSIHAALPDCSYTTAKQDVTVVAMDDVLFSRSKSDCQGWLPLELYLIHGTILD